MADMSCGSHAVYQKSRIRRLTPTECARLQTIPDWYRWGCSDTQQYRMLGNGWTVEVIKHILSFGEWVNCEKMKVNIPINECRCDNCLKYEECQEKGIFDEDTGFDFCINYEENNNTKMEFQI